MLLVAACLFATCSLFAQNSAAEINAEVYSTEIEKFINECDYKKTEFVEDYKTKSCIIEAIVVTNLKTNKKMNDLFLIISHDNLIGTLFKVEYILQKGIMNLFKDFKYNPIEDDRFAIFKDRFEELSEQEKMVIDLVINTFGKYSGKVLEDITHEESPWKNARAGYESSEPSREIISKDEIKDYFISVADRYGVDTEEKLNNYIQSYM